MKKFFNCIGIVGHPRHPNALATHEMLCHWLTASGYQVIVEQQIADDLNLHEVMTGTLAEIGQQADLAVVIGGTGTCLAQPACFPAMILKSLVLTAGTWGF